MIDKLSREAEFVWTVADLNYHHRPLIFDETDFVWLWKQIMKEDKDFGCISRKQLLQMQIKQ